MVRHGILLDGRNLAAIDDPETFAAWIDSLRRAVRDLHVETTTGPTPGPRGSGAGEMIVGHRHASGTHESGFPGAAAIAGTPLRSAARTFRTLVSGFGTGRSRSLAALRRTYQRVTGSNSDFRTSRLLEQLSIAHGDGRFAKLIGQLARTDLLALDSSIGSCTTPTASL